MRRPVRAAVDAYARWVGQHPRADKRQLWAEAVQDLSPIDREHARYLRRRAGLPGPGSGGRRYPVADGEIRELSKLAAMTRAARDKAYPHLRERQTIARAVAAGTTRRLVARWERGAAVGGR